MKNEPQIIAGAVGSKRLAEREELERHREAAATAAAHARAARTVKLEAAIEAAYAAIAARLEVIPVRNRPSVLRQHIVNKGFETYGLKRAPGWDILRRVCRRLE